MSVTSTLPLHGSYLMPTLEHATVADAMHPGIVSCPPDATLTEVARVMATNHVHCVAVMGVAREDPGERLVWAIVSDLDLVRAGLDPDGADTAATLAQTAIAAIDAATPLREAAARMLTHRVSHLVVIDIPTQRPVGILSTLDIAGVLAWGEA
jgi:CBS domain-containing protein